MELSLFGLLLINLYTPLTIIFNGVSILFSSRSVNPCSINPDNPESASRNSSGSILLILSMILSILLVVLLLASTIVFNGVSILFSSRSVNPCPINPDNPESASRNSFGSILLILSMILSILLVVLLLASTIVFNGVSILFSSRSVNPCSINPDNPESASRNSFGSMLLIPSMILLSILLLVVLLLASTFETTKSSESV